MMDLLKMSLAVPVAAALLALLSSRRSSLVTGFGAGGAVAGALMAGMAALGALKGGGGDLSAPWPVPGGAFLLHLDPLAAFFLLPISLLALLCALYAVGYLRNHPRPAALGFHWFFFNLLLAALILVVTAANTVLFLAAWEVMTLTSFFLVSFEHRQGEVRRAAWLYLAMAHLGLVLLLAFFSISGTISGSLNFADFSSLARLSPGSSTLLFALAVAGFGIKAGLFPLHCWLPDAHPAAPSHISALMSGVLVKTGIYGILRVYGFLPEISPLCGAALMALGAGGALYAMTLAAFQRDIKRCLAYSTIENVGIIFLGIGMGIFALREGYTVPALLGFAGALLHIWNHTLFKGLLFLGAGNLLHATGTRNMNRMGGLLRRMPWTGALLIGGGAAIAALPPLNGFVSEWLIYLALLRAGTAAGSFGGFGILLLLALLGLVGALAVVVFTRLVGIALLGEARSAEGARAHEAGFWMLAPPVLLLLGCLAIGLFPAGAAGLLSGTLALLVPGGGPALSEATASLQALGSHAILLWVLPCVAALLLWVLHRRRPSARGATWGCGFAFPSSRMSYTGEGYSELTRQHLAPRSLSPAPVIEEPAGVFPAPGRVAQGAPDPVLVRVLQPLIERVAHHCVRLRWLQQGKLQVYLLYVFLACLALISWSVLPEGVGGWGPP